MSNAPAPEDHRLRVLLLAEACNPDWPSLPIVAYRYALALGERCDVTIATQVRNRPAIEAAAPGDDRFVFFDNEWIAGPIHRVASWIRGNPEVAWSTNMILGYLPYLAFERAVWTRFRADLKAGAFDIVHRITPMTPTFPSPIAGRAGVPFVLGPLNGALGWPAQFRAEQVREKERARVLRDVYKVMPYARGTQKKASLILAGFQHTIDDLGAAPRERIVNFPEIGFNPDLFHAGGRRAPFSGEPPFRFLYAGRLVPYKLPEVVVRAMAGSDALAPHHLRVIGDGPERGRLERIARDLGVADRVHFEGRRSQAEVAQAMRDCDAFVFPSIRELGAGVVIEAMACGIACIVADYGAPGHLCGDGRGHAVPLGDLDAMVGGVRAAMEGCLTDPEDARARAALGHDWAFDNYTWDRKADHTCALYGDVLAGRPFPVPGPYD